MSALAIMNSLIMGYRDRTTVFSRNMGGSSAEDRLAARPNETNVSPCYCTVRVTLPVSVRLPEVPVTVMVYVPAVVPEVGSGAQEWLTLPQARMPPANIARRARIEKIARQLRRRTGIPIKNKQARMTPPPARQGRLGAARVDELQGLLALAVVEMVRVAVPALALVRLTGAVVPKLRVGGSVAPLGPDVTDAVSATSPVKPPEGVTVMVDVFWVVEPAGTETEVQVIAMEGVATGVALASFEGALVPVEFAAVTM